MLKKILIPLIIILVIAAVIFLAAKNSSNGKNGQESPQLLRAHIPYELGQKHE